MKTAQDVSATAVLCLAGALLVGNMLMPERQQFEYVTGWTPTSEATTPDLSEGRSLERLLDKPGNGTGKLVQSPPHEVILGGQRNETAIRELIDLWHLRLPAQKPALMSDSASMMMILSFVIVGMAATFTDITELSEDEKAVAVNTKEEANQIIVSSASRLRILKSATLCISTVVLAVLLCFPCLKSLDASDSSDEYLSKIESAWELDNGYTDYTTLDGCVMLVLGAVLVLGLFIMKADICEMAEEIRRTSNSETKKVSKVEENQPDTLSHSSTSRLLVVSGVVAFVSIAVAMWCKGQMPPNCVEQTSITELKTLARLVDSFFNVLLDFILEFFLGAFAVVGFAVMRFDVCDMVKQLQDESGQKVTSSPSRIEAK